MVIGLPSVGSKLLVLSLPGPALQAMCWLRKLATFIGCLPKRAAEGLGVFKFCDAAARELPPGLCGHAALLDLRAYILRQAPVSDANVASHATEAYYSNLQRLQGVGAGRMPCLVAGVFGAMLEQGLTSLLREKGVPDVVASSRAKDLLQRAGPQAFSRLWCRRNLGGS